MMAMEADAAFVREPLDEANRRSGSSGVAEIACFKGPQSFRLAGPTSAIDAVQAVIASDAASGDKYGAIRSKR